MPSFGALGVAAYCPRQLWYHRRDDRTPDRADDARALASAYPRLRARHIDGDRLAVTPATAAKNLDRIADKYPTLWTHLTNPAETAVTLQGRDAHGEIAKLLATDPPTPTLVSSGDPPDHGVWDAHAVRGTAAALALAWETDHPIPETIVEYPRHGIVRRVQNTARRRATYRRLRRTVESMDGPPPRIDNTAKCNACHYQDECGVPTHSLHSRL